MQAIKCSIVSNNNYSVMQFLDPGYLREIALTYCIEHTFGFDSMSEEEREAHVQKAIDLLLERPEIKNRVFANRLN
jgi:hypothetical protein